MAKIKSAYVCADCGAEFSKWQGQCTECQAWNTLSEVRLAAKAGKTDSRGGGYTGANSSIVTALAKVSESEEQRTTIGIAELDRVLGGGLVRGSVVLIGGDPGIGKSTLVLQALSALAGRSKALYVTGEESLGQVASRARRLGLSLDSIDAWPTPASSAFLKPRSLRNRTFWLSIRSRPCIRTRSNRRQDQCHKSVNRPRASFATPRKPAAPCS
jgi:DNA repair protein RadA/Sms